MRFVVTGLFLGSIVHRSTAENAPKARYPSESCGSSWSRLPDDRRGIRRLRSALVGMGLRIARQRRRLSQLFLDFRLLVELNATASGEGENGPKCRAASLPTSF